MDEKEKRLRKEKSEKGSRLKVSRRSFLKGMGEALVSLA